MRDKKGDPVDLRLLETKVCQRLLDDGAALRFVGPAELEDLGGAAQDRGIDGGQAVGAKDDRDGQALFREAINAPDEGVHPGR